MHGYPSVVQSFVDVCLAGFLGSLSILLSGPLQPVLWGLTIRTAPRLVPINKAMKVLTSLDVLPACHLRACPPLTSHAHFILMIC